MRSNVDINADLRPDRNRIRMTLDQFIAEDLDGQVIDGGNVREGNGEVDTTNGTISGNLSGIIAGEDRNINVTGEIDGQFLGERGEGIAGDLVLRPEGADALDGDYNAD